MKYIASVVSCLVLTGNAALAQQNQIFPENLSSANSRNSAILSGSIKIAVHTKGELELGYYYDIGSSKTVLFNICGTEKTMVLSIDDLESSVSDCSSVPGKPANPFKIGNISKWIYNEESNSYTVYYSQGTNALTRQVPCADLPAGILIAARAAANGQEAVIGRQRTANLMAAYFGEDKVKSLAVNFDEKAQRSDCELAKGFATIPTSVNFLSENVLVGVAYLK